jgi:hypothetical protein
MSTGSLLVSMLTTLRLWLELKAHHIKWMWRLGAETNRYPCISAAVNIVVHLEQVLQALDRHPSR